MHSKKDGVHAGAAAVILSWEGLQFFSAAKAIEAVADNWVGKRRHFNLSVYRLYPRACGAANDDSAFFIVGSSP